jgi:CHASE1-domain containing sensor protein
MSARDPDITRHEGSTMRRRLPAWLVMCNPASVAMGIGLVLSLAGAYAVSQWEERVTRVEFEGVAETQSIIMQNGMNEYISRLVALRTLFESANEEVTRSEFEAFAGRLFERHPGILRVAWLPRVNRKERAEYEAARSPTEFPATGSNRSMRMAALRPRRRMTSTILSSFPPSRRPRWSMAWIMRRPPSGGRRSNVRATTT